MVQEERRAQTDQLRCVLGNPFRLVTVNPARRAGTVSVPARSLDESRRFGDLPILADALEEAGRAEAQVLGHCRGPGPHALGCWVLDLLRPLD